MKWDVKRLSKRTLGNGRLKLFSIAFACGLWLFVNYAERDAEKTLVVPVEFHNLSSQLVINGPRDEYVDLRLRGPRSLLGQLNSKKIKLDLSEVRPGMASFRITADMLNLPRGVRLIRINPAQVNLSIAQIIKQIVPVRLELMGNPPRGYAVKDTEVNPDRIEVTGPAPQVEKIRTILTDPLDLSSLTQPITRDLALRGPEEGFVSYSRDRVQVRVGVEEVVATQEFRNIKIAVKNAELRAEVRPAVANVTVRGPQRLIENLVLNEEHVFADTNGQGPGRVMVPLSVVLPPGIELVEQDPENVEVRLLDDSKKKVPKPRSGAKVQTSGVHRWQAQMERKKMVRAHAHDSSAQMVFVGSQTSNP
jgi:YbbR domain-containing protein